MSVSHVFGSVKTFNGPRTDLMLQKNDGGIDINFFSAGSEIRAYRQSGSEYVQSRFQKGQLIYTVQTIRDRLRNERTRLRLTVATQPSRFSDQKMRNLFCGPSPPDASDNILRFSEAVQVKRFTSAFDPKSCGGKYLPQYASILSKAAERIVEDARNCSAKLDTGAGATDQAIVRRYLAFYQSGIVRLMTRIDQDPLPLVVDCSPRRKGSAEKPPAEVQLQNSGDSIARIPAWRMDVSAELEEDDSELEIAEARKQLGKLIGHELGKHIVPGYSPARTQSICEHEIGAALEKNCRLDRFSATEFFSKFKSPDCSFENDSELAKRQRPIEIADVLAQDQANITQADIASVTADPPSQVAGTEVPRTFAATVAATSPAPDKVLPTIAAADNSGGSSGGGDRGGGRSPAPELNTGYARPIEPPTFREPTAATQDAFRGAAAESSRVHESVFGSRESDRSDRSDRRGPSVQSMAAALLAGNNTSGSTTTAGLSDRISDQLTVAGSKLTALANSIVPPAVAATLEDNQIIAFEGSISTDGSVQVASGPAVADAAARDWVGLGAMNSGSVSSMATASQNRGGKNENSPDSATANGVGTSLNSLTFNATAGYKSANGSRAQSAANRKLNGSPIGKPKQVAGLAASGGVDGITGAESDPDGSASGPTSLEPGRNQNADSKASAKSTGANAGKMKGTDADNPDSTTSQKITAIKLTPAEQRQMTALFAVDEFSDARYAALKKSFSKSDFQTALLQKGICIQVETPSGLKLLGAKDQCGTNGKTNGRTPAAASNDPQELMRNLQNRRRGDAPAVIIFRDNGTVLKRVR